VILAALTVGVAIGFASGFPLYRPGVFLAMTEPLLSMPSPAFLREFLFAGPVTELPSWGNASP